MICGGQLRQVIYLAVRLALRPSVHPSTWPSICLSIYHHRCCLMFNLSRSHRESSIIHSFIPEMINNQTTIKCEEGEVIISGSSIWAYHLYQRVEGGKRRNKGKDGWLWWCKGIGRGGAHSHLGTSPEEKINCTHTHTHRLSDSLGQRLTFKKKKLTLTPSLSPLLP